ncbi:MAG: Arc family DNA-binding protein [Planctomycetes bacterium]|nr:Arc family DNA-binding protein [Planctomycetota bacterium]
MSDDKKGFLLRVPAELLEQLRGWAEQEMRSLNGQIEWILREALRARGRVTDADSPRIARKRKPPM